MLIVLSAVPLYGATPASVSGLVRNEAGVPQIGAIVQLLRPDFSVVATVYTDDNGHFKFDPVAPGRYELKAMAMSFLPSLRENVHVRHANAVVDLTLSTLYEAIQWLPSKPRSINAQQDDWAWTLRSAADRPLLRWVGSGPLVVVDNGSGAAPRLKTRLMTTGATGTFGENGPRYTAAIEDALNGSSKLLARVNFAPNSTGGMESMLGFRQDLGYAGSMQTVAALSMHPDMSVGQGQGFNEAALRSSEFMNFGPNLNAEVGGTEVFAHIGGAASNTVTTTLPYAQVNWIAGDTTIGYRMATMVPNPLDVDETATEAALPIVSASNGKLAVEHGMHQEISWERQTSNSSMAVVIYSDSIQNPALEALSQFGSGNPAAPLATSALVDQNSGLLLASGPAYSSSGVEATVERRLPGDNDVRLTYASGKALVMPASAQPVTLLRAVASAQARPAQMYTLALAGTLNETATRWQASYQWQASNTITAVAPYAMDAVGPYLNIYVRQPIRLRCSGACGIDALIDVSNLLAEGYRPYLLSDGSVVLFAQGPRCIRGGLAFTF